MVDAGSSTERLYNQMYSKVAELYPVLQKEDLYQFPMEPTDAEWGSDATDNAYRAYIVGDQLPKSHGTIYLGDPGSLMSVQWKNWLQLISNAPKDPNDKTYLGLKNRLNTAIAQRDETFADATKAWLSWLDSDVGKKLGASFTDPLTWMQSAYGKAYGAKYGGLDAEVTDLQGQIAKYLTDSVLNNMLAALENKKNWTDYIHVGTQFHRPITYIEDNQGKDLAANLTNWRTGPPEFPRKFELDAITEPTIEQKKIVKDTYTEKSYFFGLYKKSTYTREEITVDFVAYEHFDLWMDFDYIHYFEIRRSDWFDSNFMKDYKGHNLSAGHKPAEYFDTETGNLTLTPVGVLVGFNPGVSITIKNSIYQKYKEAFNDVEDGVIVGPYIFGKGKKAKVTTQGDSTTVSYPSISDNLERASLEPIVLGYTHLVTNL